MADFKYDVKEFIAPLKESDKHDWVKAVCRISWNDNPATIDIRNMNMSLNKVGKGISLSDDEASKLVEVLLDEGYGSMDIIETALRKKRSCFEISTDDITEEFGNTLVINIEV